MTPRQSIKLFLLGILFTGLCTRATLAEDRIDDGTQLNTRTLWFRQPAMVQCEAFPLDLAQDHGGHPTVADWQALVPCLSRLPVP